MLGVWGQYNRNFSRRIYMKIAFSSQRREMLLFLTANMAAVTSRGNQQYSSHLFIQKRIVWQFTEFTFAGWSLKKMIEDLNDVVGSKWALLHKVKFLSQLAKRFKHNKIFCLRLLCWLIGRNTFFSRVKNIVHSSDWLKFVCVCNKIITTRLNILER